MKLIDIIKKLPWPDGASRAVQDRRGVIWWSSVDDIQERRSASLADDYATAIITHADWMAAQEQVGPKERQPGFYWVADEDGEWCTAEWVGECWWIGSDMIYPTEIDERRIVRES